MVYSARRFVVCLTLCHFVLVFFSVLLALRLPRLGKRELILVLFVRLIDLCLFGFVGFLFLLMSGNAAVCDCGSPQTFLERFFFAKPTIAFTLVLDIFRVKLCPEISLEKVSSPTPSMTLIK